MTTAPSIQRPTPLAAVLRDVHVGLREDLEVTRHVFRGEVAYVMRDPMTFQSQRLSREDYEVLVHIQDGSSLSAIFDELVGCGRLEAADEERFYQFVLSLHRLGFLRLPVSDDNALYERYQARQRMRRREKLMGFLFLRVPLWNPDAFLSRTMHLARPLFSTYAYALWAVLCLAAGYVAFTHRAALAQPIHGVLVAGNLPLLFATLVALKVIHEFGHAYACKHYGGHVPEMGAYLIVFTPCAYVDATACWGFTRKRQRLMVCAAGMYVESIVAALAVFVWASTGPSLLNAAAYNAIFLAGVVTVLFNANPLMRYDGYYILSDWLEIPNLRQRAVARVLTALKRVFLGLRTAAADEPARLRWTLIGYGFAASLYRVALVLTIAAVLATKFKAVGLAVGGLFVGSAAIGAGRKLVRYLWHAEETAPVRMRAVTLGMTVFLVLPTAIFWLPLSADVRAPGVVGAERELVIRPQIPGYVERIDVVPGTAIRNGQPIAKLHNDAPRRAILEATAGLAASRIRADAFRIAAASRVEQEQARESMYRAALQRAREQRERLSLTAAAEGTVVEALDRASVGQYLDVGAPVALITSGRPRIRTIVSEQQLARIQVQVGDRVEFRTAAAPWRDIDARVLQILPAGSRLIATESLTQQGTKDIPVDDVSGAAQQPYFEVLLEVDASPARGRHTEGDQDLWYGMTGYALLPAEPEPIGKALGRQVLRFWERLMQG